MTVTQIRNLVGEQPVERSPAPAALTLRGLCKSYGSQSVLRDLSFDVAGGASFALLGPSGCGKTTTLSLIAGIVQQDAGQVLVDGKDVSKLPTHRRDIGVVFQGYALFPHMSVRDNIAFGLKASRQPKAVIRERVEWALKLGRLENLGDRYPNQISGGQQQRTALVRSLVTRPRVMLLDEPLSNLDAALREEMRRELRRIQQETGVTTVLVTHDQTEAMELGHVIGVMDKGELLQVGDPKSLYNTPANPFVANFLGNMNYIPGMLAEKPTGSFLCDLGPVQFPVAASDLPKELRRSGSVCVGIRPEAICCASPGEGRGVVELAAEVREVTYLGTHLDARVSIGCGDRSRSATLRVMQIRPGEWQDALQAGEPFRNAGTAIVTITMHPSDFHYFAEMPDGNGAQA